MRMILGFVLLLVAAGFIDTAQAGARASNGAFIPVYPPYPYRSGHYPKADWYYQLPPYAAIRPSFYRWRYFMLAQERNRYRYMPHIFHGHNEGGIEPVDLQGMSGSIESTYRDSK